MAVVCVFGFAGKDVDYVHNLIDSACMQSLGLIQKSDSEKVGMIFCSLMKFLSLMENMRINNFWSYIKMIGFESEVKKDQPCKKSILFANNSLTYIQLGQLQRNINELVHQNKIKYGKISQAKLDFKYQLYRIGQFQANSKAFGKELLLRQLDRLLEEKNYLDRQLSLIRFEHEEEIIQKEKMVSNETNHFELLKSIWRKDASKNYDGCLDHIEDLNLMVGQIKSNIQSLIKFQSNDKKDFQETYLNTFKVLHQKNKHCNKCTELNARNDFLQSKIQSLEEKLSKVNDQNIAYLQQINAKEDKIKKLTKNQLKIETELKDKIIRLEQEILKKDHSIKQIKKQLAEFNEGKFSNQEEGFEVYIKGTNIDISKYHKKINLKSEELIRLISEESPKELRVTQSTVKRSSGRSQGESTEGSLKSYAEENEDPQEMPAIKITEPSQNEKRQGDKMDKRKNSDRGELKCKLEENETAKRYVRTSSKRGQHSGHHIYDDSEEGISSVKARGASPVYGFSLQ